MIPITQREFIMACHNADTAVHPSKDQLAIVALIEAFDNQIGRVADLREETILSLVFPLLSNG